MKISVDFSMSYGYQEDFELDEDEEYEYKHLKKEEKLDFLADKLEEFKNYATEDSFEGAEVEKVLEFTVNGKRITELED